MRRLIVQLSFLAGLAVAGHAGAQPTTYSCSVNSSSDPTADWCTTPNFPYYGQPSVPLLKNPKATPGDGLTLGANAANVASYVFGSGQASANVLTTLDVYNSFFLDCAEGNLNNTIGSPNDTCQQNNNEFYGVARHYDIGDPNNLHVVQSDGLHLNAHCAGSGYTNCSPGNVYAAWIRLPGAILPGEVIKVRYKGPPATHSWTPIWLFSGTQLSPGPMGNPYNAGLLQFSNTALEIDMNDNYCRYYNSPSVACGYQLDYLLPVDSSSESVKYTYWANSNGYTYYGPASNPQFDALAFNWSQGFHDLVMSLSAVNATTGLVTSNILVDGLLVAQSTFKFDTSTQSGSSEPVGLSLMIGNQPVPVFDNATNVVDNDGIAGGWTIVVQELSVWKGGLTSAPRAGNNGCNVKPC